MEDGRILRIARKFSMIFEWLNAKEATEFGVMLADHFDQKVREIASASVKKQEAKRQKLVAEVLARARQYKATTKMNAFKKAKLGNAFRWRLSDLGHDAELIELMTKDVMLALQ